MGESKRKKSQQPSALSREEAAFAAAAVRQVVAAITEGLGSDCILYANIGSEFLNELGMNTRVVAGSAAWRVGDGDSDVVSHAREIKGPIFAPTGAKALIYHAWIEAPSMIIDFSTHTLRDKAQVLDQADGGKTDVSWCPEFLWHILSPDAIGNSGVQLREPRQVLMAPKAGVFNYSRHTDIEAVLFADQAILESSLTKMVFAARMAYRAKQRGEEIFIKGIGSDGELQSEPVRMDYEQIAPFKTPDP